MISGVEGYAAILVQIAMRKDRGKGFSRPKLTRFTVDTDVYNEAVQCWFGEGTLDM